MKVIIVWLKNTALAMGSSDLILTKLIKLTIFAGAFLLPLFFIPVSERFLEYSKILLFVVLVISALFLAGLKSYLSKQITWQFKPLDSVAIFLFILYVFSVLFSVDRYRSLWGSDLQISYSLTVSFFLLIFYFLVSRFLVRRRDFKVLLTGLLVAIFVLTVVKTLNFFQISLGFSFLGISISTYNFLLLIGIIISFVLYLLDWGKKYKVINLIIGAIFLLLLFLIDNQTILLLLSISIFLLILLLSLRSAYFSNKLVISLTALLFLTVVVLIVPISNFTQLVSPSEFKLPANLGWEITKASLGENFLFGVGPQNFLYSFYKYKPVDYNYFNFWQLAFKQNSNFWLEILNNLGVLFIALIVAGVIGYFYQLIVYFRQLRIVENKQYQRFIIVVASSVLLGVFILNAFFTNYSFILVYLFVLFVSCGVGFVSRATEKIVFNNRILVTFFSYLLLIVIITTLYFGLRLVKSDYYRERALMSFGDNIKAEQDLSLSYKYNPWQPDYDLQLTNLLVDKFESSINNPDADMSLMSEELLSSLDQTVNKELKRADYYYSALALTAQIKTSLTVYDQEKNINDHLIKLDPQNPELYIDRALLNFRSYLVLKEQGIEVEAQQDLLKKIKRDLDKSLELKNDYILGYFNLGLYWQELGDEAQASNNLKKAYELDPSQKLIIVNLKKLYLNQDKVEEAQNILERYLQINSDDTEIKLQLAEIYKDTDQASRARELLADIPDSDPLLEDVRAFLKQLP